MVTVMTRYTFLLYLAFLLITFSLSISTQARDSGWVPLKNNNAANMRLPYTYTPLKKGAQKEIQKKENSKGQFSSGSSKRLTVYANQPPVTEKELGPFMELLPRFRVWASKNGEEAHPVVGDNGEPDFIYSANAAKWVSSQNFEPSRFFCIMGRLAAGLVIVEEGNDHMGTRPADMPAVDPQEIALVRKHLGELLTVGGPPKPLLSP